MNSKKQTLLDGTRLYSVVDLTEGRESVLPISRATLFRMVQRGDFPPGIRLGSFRYWTEPVVKDWVAQFCGYTDKSSARTPNRTLWLEAFEARVNEVAEAKASG
jgi:predicted DNA-binding transcriptional regulator AlpA